MATLPAVKQFTDRVSRIEISATMAVVAEASKLKSAGADLVEFGAGEPHFSTPQHIKDAAIAAIQQDFTRYTAVPGMPELRSAIVKRHATDFGSDYRPEETIASTGGKLALFNAIQVLVDHGDEVILPVPYWVSFKDIIEYGGGKCVYVETDESEGFRLTAEMIERSVTPRTRAIIINSPNNPSGAVIDPEDFMAILRMAHKRGIYVIADECYVYLNYTGRTFSAGSVREAKEHVVIAGSMSKTYAMTGWRLGYALAPVPYRRGHDQAAEPEYFQFGADDSEGRCGCSYRITAVRRRHESRVHSIARSDSGSAGQNSGNQLREAARCVLRLSQCFIVLWPERRQLRR